MSVETDSDRMEFLDAGEYAATARWVSAGGTNDLSVIFDTEYHFLNVPLIDSGAEGAGPQFICRDVDVPDDAGHGDSITLYPATPRAKAYCVVELKPDGTGMTTVRLQED